MIDSSFAQTKSLGIGSAGQPALWARTSGTEITSGVLEEILSDDARLQRDEGAAGAGPEAAPLVEPALPQLLLDLYETRC